MKSKHFLLAALFTCISVVYHSCISSSKIAANYPHEIECIGSELDGSVTLKSWGKGSNREDALEQARKEAVNAVLFAGIRSGSSSCDSRPILNAPNIREKKSDFFDSFFKDGGPYKNYVSLKDESFGKKERVNGRDGEVMYGFVIRVYRSELKKLMIKEGILNI